MAPAQKIKTGLTELLGIKHPIMLAGESTTAASYQVTNSY